MAHSARKQRRLVIAVVAISGALCAPPIATAIAAENSSPLRKDAGKYYLPDAAGSRVVAVTKGGAAAAEITVQTVAVADNETGPKATVSRFGEVYAFSPNFIAIHRDQPTLLTFWNLQSDDEHDFMLVDANSQVLMHVKLPPLRKTPYLFTFHEEGLFNFYCTVHQPEMSGQILVLPPVPQKPQ